jgi:sugar phosphate isomerase/epimerase
MDNDYPEYENGQPGVRLAISSSILAEFGLDEAIAIAAELGYEGIALGAAPTHLPDDADDVRVEVAAQQLMTYGLLCVALETQVGHFAVRSDAQCEVELSKFRRYMEIARQVGSYLIQVEAGGPPPGAQIREDHWLRAAHYLRECCDIALGRDIEVIVETQPGLTATVDGTLYLVDLVNRPNFGVAYNPGNLFSTDPHYGIEALARLGTLIFNVRVADATRSNGHPPEPTLLGEGDINYQAIFRSLLGAGYQGFVSAACRRVPDHQISSIDIARHELAAMRQLLEEAL